MPCLGRAPGRVAVAAKHFHEVVRKMPRGAVTLRTEKNQLEAGYGDGKGWSRFPVQKSDEYPDAARAQGRPHHDRCPAKRWRDWSSARRTR